MDETAMGEAADERGDFADRRAKYLTFSLGEEEYGIPILKVKEIIGMMPFTPVPQMPPCFKGVVNLRGKVIPVIDLRVRLGLPPEEYTERTCIIVAEVPEEEGIATMGMVVDSVSEVLNIGEEDIEAPPRMGAQARADYIRGMAKAGGEVKILLDANRIVGLLQWSASKERGESEPL